MKMLCTRRGRGWRIWIAGLLFGVLAYPLTLSADEIRPALLEINERDGGWIDVVWKVPMLGDRVENLTPILPEFFEQVGAGSGRRVPGAWLQYGTYRSDGLIASSTDVLVRITLADDTEHSTILRSGKDSFTIPEQATRVELAISYWQMGTVHILEGVDHLLFLLTLLLIVTGILPLLKTVTAFTVAHSLT